MKQNIQSAEQRLTWERCMGSGGIVHLKNTCLKACGWRRRQRHENSVGIQDGRSGEGVYAIKNTLWHVIDSAVYCTTVIEQFET